MTSPSQRKIRERFFLERFLSGADIKAVIASESERPDFGITFEGRAVGVEVTEVFVESLAGNVPLQAHEALTSKVISSARKRYECAGGTPLHVSVSFSSKVELRRGQLDSVAKALAELLLRAVVIKDQYFQWDNDYANPELSAVAFVSALGRTDLKFAHWSATSTGWMVPLTNEVLQTTVSRKSQRLTEYRKHYGEVWLLVAAEGARPSQFFDLSWLSNASAIKSDFDRTYFLSSFTGEVIRLGTQ